MFTLHRVLLFLHVVSILMLAIGDVGALVATLRARSFESSQAVLALMQYHRSLIRSQLIPGAVGSLVSGVALAWLLEVPYSALWVLGTFIAWVLSLAIGIALLLPDEARAIREAQRLVDSGMTQCSPELRDAVGSRRVVVGEWTTAILLVAMTFLMVFKPV